MLKVLLIGNSPLPNSNANTRPAAGLRTFQFYSSLKKENIDLKVLTIAMEKGEKETLKDHINIDKDDAKLQLKAQKMHDAFKPDLIISVNTFPSFVASKLESKAILWADLNGWVMSEAQAQAFKIDSNDLISHYYKMEKTIVSRADKISAVSIPEMNAILGELAFCGRLNKETFKHKFVHHIPNATEIFESEKGDREACMETVEKIPHDKCLALWLGGYNTWVDEITLADGILDAMSKSKDLYYISTGGAINGLDNKTFEGFYKKVTESKFADRFVFLGWIKTEEIPYIYKVADIGLNIDRLCTETLTGARNRINEMMKFGLPVVSSLGSEISYQLKDSGAGLTFESGDSAAFSRALCELYNLWEGKNASKEDLKEMGRKGRNYISKNCNYDYTNRELIDFIKAPYPAPDREIKVGFGFLSKLKAAKAYIKQSGLKKFSKKLWQKLSTLLGRNAND